VPFPTITPTIPELLRSAAAAHGERPLLLTGGESLTYAEAEQRSRRLAKALLAQGIRKGDHVGILFPNGSDWVVAWYAVTRIGAVAVPINTFYRPAELGWTIRHADVVAVLTVDRFLSNDYLALLEEAVPGLNDRTAGERPLIVASAPLLRHVVVWGEGQRGWAVPAADLLDAGDGSDVDDAVLEAVEACVTPADPVVIIYTSGSTGEPKAPVHSHGAFVRHTYNLTFMYVTRGEDVLFTSMPFFWVGGLITGLHAVIHHGAVLVTQPAFDAGEALELMERHRATIALGWPQQGKTLSEHPTFAKRDLSSIRRTSMLDLVPPDRRPPPVWSNSLGMTELCGNHVGADPYEPQPEHRRGTFGRSLEGLEHRVVDPETGDVLPPGTEGELWARGYSLMLGLYKREREDVFTPDGFYRTGDAGWMDEDGWFFFTGRLGDMIKTGGGTNVAPGEVEAALMALPGVLEAYVTGVPDGAGGQVVAAAVVPKADAELDAAALKADVRKTISAYKVPKVVWVTTKDQLPFTPSGKIKKTDLAVQLADHEL